MVLFLALLLTPNLSISQATIKYSAMITFPLPSFKNGDYYFRTIDQNDSAFIEKLYGDEKLMEYIDYPVIKTEDELELFYRNIEESRNKQTGEKWIIEEAGTAIGIIGIYAIDKKHAFASQTCILSPEVQGRGKMVKIFQAFNTYSLTHFGINRFEAQIHTDNIASIKTLQKAGYNLDGIMRQNYFLQGIFSDSYCFSIIKKDLF